MEEALEIMLRAVKRLPRNTEACWNSTMHRKGRYERRPTDWESRSLRPRRGYFVLDVHFAPSLKGVRSPVRRIGIGRELVSVRRLGSLSEKRLPNDPT